MKKFFVVVDCQNDFVTGSLANPAAQAALPKIKEAAETAKKDLSVEESTEIVLNNLGNRGFSE